MQANSMTVPTRCKCRGVIKINKMTTQQEITIVEAIKKVMVNNNYRMAYEEAIKMAKEMKVSEKSDFFPFVFALDIRGEKADNFIKEVTENEVTENEVTENEKIYRIQLILNDTIEDFDNEKITVFVTKDENEAKQIFEKLSENKNLKYILE